MAAHLEVIGGDGVPHPAHPVLLLAFRGVLGAEHLAVGDGIGEEPLLLLRVVQSKGRADVEALEQVNAQVGIAEHAPLGIAVVLAVLQDAQRILAFGIRTQCLGVFAVLRIDGIVRIELQRVFDDVTGSVHAAGAVQVEVLSEGHLPAEQLVVAVGTCRNTAEISGLDGTLVAIIAQREKRGALL